MSSTLHDERGQDHNKTWAAFLGALVIGGANFVAVSYSNMTLPPLFGAALRFGMAALLFFAIARLWRVELVRGRAALGPAVYGVLAYGIAYAGLYYALLGLSAGTVSVIVAAVPLFTLGIAVALRQEQLTSLGVLGGVLVILGIGVLSIGALAGGLQVLYLAAALLGAVSIAASAVLARALKGVHPVNMNAFGLAAGAALLTLGSWVSGEHWSVPGDAQTLLAVGWLIVLGSVGLFQLFLYVVQRWSASATVYALAGMPVVAAALGAALLGQPVTLELVVGGLLVILAIGVGTRRPASRASRAQAAVQTRR